MQQYVELGYWPSAERHLRLTADGQRRAAALAAWRRKLQQAWGQIRVEAVEPEGGTDLMRVGSELKVRARVHLGPLSPEDVQVQLFHGALDALGEISRPHTAPMQTQIAVRNEAERNREQFYKANRGRPAQTALHRVLHSINAEPHVSPAPIPVINTRSPSLKRP